MGVSNHFSMLKPVGQFEGPNKNSSIQNAECFNLVGRWGAYDPLNFLKMLKQNAGEPPHWDFGLHRLNPRCTPYQPLRSLTVQSSENSSRSNGHHARHARVLI